MGLIEKCVVYSKNYIQKCKKYINIDVTEKTCLCESLHIVLWIIRIFGLLPIKWDNINNIVGNCLYRKSIKWKLYQYSLILILLWQLYEQIFNRFNNIKSILHLR